MLSELELQNFLSYEHVKVSFPPNSTIAVVGEVGNGKSGLLESIYFCLYGEGRDDLLKLVRIKSEGVMFVRLKISEITPKIKMMIVERGVKGNNAGYTKVWFDGVLVAKGGGSFKNNKAQDVINSILGVDKDSFLLTSFFGLGSNDVLMQVKPSERLETLHKLAGVSICADFNACANNKTKALNLSIEKNESVINAMYDTIDDVGLLEKEYKQKAKELKECKEALLEKQQKRSDLSKEETRYQALIREKETINGKREAKLILKDSMLKRYQGLQETLKTYKKESDILLKTRNSIEEEIKQNSKSLDAIKQEYDSLVLKKLNYEVTKTMLENAIKLKAGNKCPLCSNHISENRKEHWKIEIDRINKLIAKLENSITTKKDEGTIRASLDKKKSKIVESMKNNLEDIKDTEEELKEAKKEYESISGVLETIEIRLLSIKNEISTYANLVRTIEQIDNDVGLLLERQGTLNQSVLDVKNRIDRCNMHEKKIEDLEDENTENKKEMLAYKVVADAFSRYAIPVKLLKNLRLAIEKRATKIYQYFKTGVIRIDDIPGARPGVEFVLYDEMGGRSYKALSTGEKALMFLSVRLAITQIINATKNNRVEFLILDEIAGNLSPSKREILTKLINTLLRKYFTQIFMVSHIELRDIFNKTFLINKNNGVSEIEVIK